MVRTSRFTPNERADIVLYGLRDPKGTSELCRKHDITPLTYARWKKQYIAGGLEALQPGGRTNIELYEKENRKLKLVIGELYVELEYLKKNTGMGK